MEITHLGDIGDIANLRLTLPEANRLLKSLQKVVVNGASFRLV